MRSVAFFRLATYYNNPQFSIATRKKGNLDLPFYLHHLNTEEDPQDPGLKHLKMLIAQAPDTTLMPNQLFIVRLGVNSKRKPIPADKIPDLWTLEGVALASERFLDCLGGDAEQLGIVRPIELYDFANDQLFPGRYFTFIGRRVAKVDALESEYQDELSDNRFIIPQEKSWLRRMIYDEDIVSFLGGIPLWVLFNKPDVLFLSHTLFQRIAKANLRGFVELKNHSRYGDISHVWTAAPSPDPRIAAADHAAALTAPSRSAASVAS